MNETVTINYMGKPRSLSREEALALIEAAHEEVSALCAGRFRETRGGIRGHEWRMSIPAQEGDSDLTISHALSAAEAFVKLGPPTSTEREPLKEPSEAAIFAALGVERGVDPSEGVVAFHSYDHNRVQAMLRAAYAAERGPVAQPPEEKQ